MSDISGMVAELIAAGCSPDVAASVVAKAYVAGVGVAEFRGIPVDEKAEKRRAYDRERKRKSAEIRRNSTESAETPILPLSSSILTKESKRGTRLSSEWKPAEAERAFAKTLGWSEPQIDSEAANFRDYWIAKPGAGGCKLDWPATWRKWIRSSKVKPMGSGPGAPPVSQDWETAAKMWVSIRRWPRGHGSDPDSPACQAPFEILRKHGIQPMGAS